MDTSPTVWLRADGNSRIGLGHVHRLIAISELLGGQFNRTFVIQNPLPGVKRVIEESCDRVMAIDEMDIKQEQSMLSEWLMGTELVILDGYKFSTSYQQAVKDRGCALICLDDVHQVHFVADYVLNPSGGLNAGLYSKAPHTKLLLGPSFAPVKKVFQSRKLNTAENNLFICLGGADPNNFTQLVLNRCLGYPFDNVFVVVGEAYQQKPSLDQIAQGDHRIKLFSNISSSEMAALMVRSAVAVCSASGIAYEYLSVGGELYVLESASNQHDLYNFLLADQLAFSFDSFRAPKDAVALALMRQQRVFDGYADHRLRKIANELDFDTNVVVRSVTEQDLERLFEWANDPSVRQQSYQTHDISLGEHTKWFRQRLADSTTRIYIFEYKGVAVAQVRFDLSSTALISFSIDKKFRGRGWGQRVLRRGMDQLLQDCDHITTFIGYVKKNNTGSNTIFLRLGFQQSDAREYPNSYQYEYQTQHDRNKNRA